MKSKTTAILLCFFLGFLGIHRFYLGYTLIGIIQFLTGGGFLIWVFVDFLRLLTGSLGPEGSVWKEEAEKERIEMHSYHVLDESLIFNRLSAEEMLAEIRYNNQGPRIPANPYIPKVLLKS